jgi:hypothetical protein
MSSSATTPSGLRSRQAYKSILGLLVAVPIGFVVATRFYRMRAMKASRAWLAAIRLRPAMLSLLEEWLASRLPTVWASRLHASMPQIVVLVALGVLVTNNFVRDTLLWVVTPAIVGVGLTLRAQERARHLTSSPWQQFGIFMLHLDARRLCRADRVAPRPDCRRVSRRSPGPALVSVLAGMMLQLACFSSALFGYHRNGRDRWSALSAVFVAEASHLEPDVVQQRRVFHDLAPCGARRHCELRECTLDVRFVVRRVIVGVFFF